VKYIVLLVYLPGKITGQNSLRLFVKNSLSRCLFYNIKLKKDILRIFKFKILLFIAKSDFKHIVLSVQNTTIY